ncbi:MAG: PRC-barrel domain-containing protein [Peptococcaceae bacterium]|nr:PRC-barrel domain-containing protein [Peptococcaceae bacterium]
MGVLVNVGSIMGKEILNLADGTMIGKVCGVALTPDNKVAGLKVKSKKIMGTVNVVPFENVKAFGATITVNDVDGTACADVRDAFGKNVITADGNMLGRVEELAFDAETGDIAEIVIKGELMDTMLGGRGILPGEKLVSIGKDVVIAAENITAEDFQTPAEEVYGDWKELDELLEDIEKETEQVLFEDVDDDDTEKKVETTLEGFAKTMEETFKKLKDEVTSEGFKDQTNQAIDRFSAEAKNLFGEMREWVKNIDTDSIKSKITRKEEPEDVLAADLVSQLENLTVEKPVLDEDGNVVVWPGQIIGKEEIKAALRGGKLQDLLDMATVSLLKEEPAVSMEEAEDDEPEIEVEVIVDEAFAAEESDETEPEIEVEVFVEEPELSEEDAAFIAEEAAKMEQAEDAGKEEAAAE